MRTITFAHDFARAKGLGARGVGSTVCLSSDGVPVLCREAARRRGWHRSRVETTAASELDVLGVPGLGELYEVVGRDLEVSLEVKVPEAGAAAIEVAGRHGAVDHLWLCSPDVDFLRAVREHEPDVHLVHSTDRRSIGEGLERHAADLAELGVDAVNFHRREWRAGLVTLFHRFEVKVFAWDAREVRHLVELLSFGVDGLYSDHAERMVAIVEEWERTHDRRAQ